MFVNLQKTIATSLILGLVFPYVAHAQTSTILNVAIESDATNPTPTNTNIRAGDVASPNTNFNSVAPTETTQVGNAITTKVPTIDAGGPKEEGIWNFTVSRYGELDSDTIRHDLTPPKCPISPTVSAYKNENDHYTKNNLVNPWPVGLNGRWTNNIISFPNNSPTLCRDQIGTMPQNEVKKVTKFRAWDVARERFPGLTLLPDYVTYYAENPILATRICRLKGFEGGEWADVSTASSPGWDFPNLAIRDIEDGIVVTKCLSGRDCIQKGSTFGDNLQCHNMEQTGPLSKGLKVERGYTSGQCENADGSPKFHHNDDLMDCLREINGRAPSRTLPLSQMAGCKFTSDVTITGNALAQDYVLYDKVDNYTNTADYPVCVTPVSMIDKEPAEIVNFQVEHVGLDLPKEDLTPEIVGHNKYRADAGELILHAEIKDEDASTGSGMSGINWEPLTFNPAIDQLRYDISAAEGLLNDQFQDLNTSDADIILYRSRILEKLSRLRKHIITNNLLHKISNEVNNSNNFFMQALASLAPGLESITSTTLSNTLLQDVKSLIERAKFDNIDEINTIRSSTNELTVGNINAKISTYSQELPALLNRSNLSSTGDEVDVTSTNNSFNEYYNQWQIDKTQNYSSVFPTWVQDLSETNQRVETLSTEYQDITSTYITNDILVLLQGMAEILPQTNLLSLVLSAQTTATDHKLSQEAAALVLDNVNSTLQDSKNYLQNFNPASDNFNVSKLTQITQALMPANDALGNLIRGLQDRQTDGSLSHSLHGISAIENSNGILLLINDEKSDIRRLNTEIQNIETALDIENSNGILLLINDEKSDIRRLNTEIQNIATALDKEESHREALRGSVDSQESAIVRMREELATLVSDNTNNTSTVLSLNEQKITHIEISRLTNPQKAEAFFPPSTSPVSGDNYEWDLNSYKFHGETSPLFAKAGEYQIKLRVYDQAGNLKEKTGRIRILPSTLVVDVQSNCNTASGVPYADNNETCTIELPQFDAFGNKVQNRDLKLRVRDQNINGSYNLIDELGANYQNGIRFNGGVNAGTKNELTWKPNNASLKNIKIRSLLPTITVAPYEADPDYAVGYALAGGVELPLILTHPNIGPRGMPITPVNQTNLELPVQFKPWVNVRVKGGLGNFDNRSWRPAVANPFNVYVDAGTGSSRKLPTNLRVNVAGFIGPSFEFNNVDLAKPGVNIDFANINTAYIESTGNAGKPAPLTTTINSISLLSGQQNSTSLFIPTTSYRIGSRDITVPGQLAGSCPGGGSENCFTTPPSPSVDLTISNASANEPGTLSFNIGLSAASEEDIRIYLKATDNNATIGEDYAFDSTRFVEIKAGELGATYNITVNDDDEVEDTETFALSVDTFEPASALENYSDTGTGTINDLDNGIGINTGFVTEGSLCLLDVQLERPTDSDVVITASVGAPGDTATADADYMTTNVSTTILEGETAALLSIQTNEDIIREGTERFTVTINSVTGGNLSDIQAVAACEITDNDREPNAYLLNTNVREGDKARITVVLGEQNQSGLPDNEDVTLRLQTFDLSDPATSATETLDYQSRTFDVTIPANTKSTTVPLAQGIATYTDDEIEDDESFGVRIIGVMQGRIGDYSSRANVIIEDASTPPRPSISSISSEKGVEKTPNDTIAFDVLLDYPNESGDDITIILETEDISATGGDDYSAGNLTVVIPNGQSSGKSTPVTINDDITPEDVETFRVKFRSSTPSNALLNTNIDGVGYIYDNDEINPEVTINDTTACESEGCNNNANGSLIFAANLSKPHVDQMGNPLVVTYRLTPLSASPNSDYTPGEYKATFNVGEQKAYLEPITLINDADAEAAEQFEVSFVRVESGHTLENSFNTAFGTIVDSQNSAVPNVIIDEASGVEGEQIIFNISLDSPAQGRLEIEFSAQNVTTTNADYLCPTDMVVIFATGEINGKTITCDTLLDDENEANETFELVVSNTIGTVNDTSNKGLALVNNLQTLDVVLKEPSLIMENDAAGQIEFILSLEDNGAAVDSQTGLERPMHITITPEDILAVGGTNFSVSGIDYQAGEIDVVLEPGKGEGSTFAKIGVAINNDSIKEVHTQADTYPENRQENFNMALVASAENIRSATDVEAIIQDDDSRTCADQANVKIVDTMTIEGDRMIFDISLDRTLCNEVVTLNFETIDGGAEDGLDYTGGNYSVTIPARKKRPVTKLSIPTSQDAIHEGNESFRLNYASSTPSGLIDRVERHSIRNDNSHQNRGEVPVIATIIDNDEVDITAPVMTIGNASATEGANLNFVVNLSKPAEEDTVVRLRANRLNPNPADPILDFTTGNGQPVIAVVSILAGQGAGIARITTVDDILANEGNENLSLRYSGLNRGFLSDSSDTGNGIIYDNDNVSLRPNVIITDGSAEEGAQITFTLKLENTLGESAVAPTGGIDFTIAPSTLAGANTATANEFGNGKIVRIAEGTSQRDFTIDTVDDVTDENDETFGLSITASNKTVFVNNLLATAVGTIVDNDGPAGDLCELHGINCPIETPEEPGAAIEGQIIADEIACVDGGCDGTDDDSIVLGNSTLATDIREEITRNAYGLIRGRTADNSDLSTIPLNNSNNIIIERNDFNSGGRTYPRWDIYVDDLPDGGVTYLNGDINNDGNITGDESRTYFRIGLRRNGTAGTLDNPATVSGKHTFVVVNASLNIVGDMQYAGNDDSLGIIVLNDNVENAQSMSRRGQLTVFKDVKHIVGALFTDGSLVSNVWIDAGAGGGRISAGNNANPADDWDVINGRLGQQLILSGNILSKNTIGKADKAPPEGPWGEDLTDANGQLKAQMYDFNYMRRYVPSFNAAGVQTNINQCSNIPGESGCYDNHKSFVIRVDPRLKENAPPGFTADGITKFR